MNQRKTIPVPEENRQSALLSLYVNVTNGIVNFVIIIFFRAGRTFVEK